MQLKNKGNEIEKKLEKLKEAIIIYAKSKGYNVIQGSDGKISISETTITRLPNKETKEYIQLEKIIKELNQYNQLTSIDQTKLKKYLEEKPNKTIQKLLTETTTTTIRIGKK